MAVAVESERVVALVSEPEALEAGLDCGALGGQCPRARGRSTGHPQDTVSVTESPPTMPQARECDAGLKREVMSVRRAHRLPALSAALLEPLPQHALAAVGAGAALRLQTPVSGSTSSTRRAASQSPASAATTERTCS